MKFRSRLSLFFYTSFRRYYGYSRWYFRRFTMAGRFVQGSLVLSAVAGINTKLALAYQCFGVLLGLILVGLLYVRLFARLPVAGLVVQRYLPRYATMGVEVRYRLRVENVCKRALKGMILIENHHDPRPEFGVFLKAKEPGADKLNRFDRAVGFYRWAWLVRKKEVASIPDIPLPELVPGQSAEVWQTFVPRFRGELNLSGYLIAQRDPLGVCRATREVELAGTVLVLPQMYTIPALTLPGQLHHQPEHRITVAVKGDGDELAGLRDFRSGDGLRDIHWKSFARTGKPVVKEYLAERFERHALILDNVGVGDGFAFEEAVSLAASFVGNLNGGECLLDLLFVGSEEHCWTMGPGELEAEALMRVLALVTPSPEGDLAALKMAVLSRRKELSSCICILARWDAVRREMLEELQQTGLPLLVLLVSERAPAERPQWLHVLEPGKIQEGLSQL